MSGATRDDVRRALEGDRAALTQLCRELLPVIKVEVGVALMRWARSTRRDPRQDVDDFSQNVLLHLLADGGKLLRLWDPERGRSLASFVRLIARQRVSRILQGHRGNPWSDEPTEHQDFEHLAPEPARDDRMIESREELRGLLEQLRAHLSERGLLLFQMIYVEEQPINEVAAALGMSRGAIDAWSSRTRKLARSLARERSQVPAE
ncbi:MAG: sigma-70 family RNA polymerase sigma factor [Myxococcales bacterium]|nr:sigma-70 family RNA polymerase sigma factor [Myxococcales bacterium]MCB9569701.1 sigma-70 family RNA polymerase sigma factor [Myxococcales bacterium]MCB9700506.1 sigma-70 family RNA polymerase sigma factor [Myxococcales bacterium]